jgi:outer membrane protein assembly factor BamD (BamD/ComL family)
MKVKLSEVIALRKNNMGEEALAILRDLLSLHPNNPDVNYQMAWTCDFKQRQWRPENPVT